MESLLKSLSIFSYNKRATIEAPFYYLEKKKRDEKA
jgi:hypothetical protein